MIFLKRIIEKHYKKIDKITPLNIDKNTRKTINKIINHLDKGELRVAEKINGIWITHQWLKKAIMLYFKINKNKVIKNNITNFYDKIPLKFDNWSKKRFKQKNIRIVPLANVRYGSYIANNVVLMPSYVNIGAYIDKNSMIDTWSTIGSCAQIGKNVHISGGVGIGGVLEPIQNNPTIIEDNCFIGARSEITEGVIIKEGSVISVGTFISRSTKILDRQNNKIYYGYIPNRSVVVPGNIISKNKSFGLYCAIIVKKVDNKTLDKIKLNKLLRNIK